MDGPARSCACRALCGARTSPRGRAGRRSRLLRMTEAGSSGSGRSWRAASRNGGQERTRSEFSGPRHREVRQAVREEQGPGKVKAGARTSVATRPHESRRRRSADEQYHTREQKPQHVQPEPAAPCPFCAQRAFILPCQPTLASKVSCMWTASHPGLVRVLALAIEEGFSKLSARSRVRPCRSFPMLQRFRNVSRCYPPRRTNLERW